jgi:hypothetical protein
MGGLLAVVTSLKIISFTRIIIIVVLFLFLLLTSIKFC